MFRSILASAAAATLLATGAESASVHPTSYTMQNGQGSGVGGSFSYRDESYDGPGAPVGSELALLSGGTGDLTDGIIPTQNWNAGGQAAATPYVAWVSIDPRITFFFDGAQDFLSVTFHFDDSNGDGGVLPPRSVEINDSFLSLVSDPASGAPFAHVIDLTGVAPSNTLTFDINRRGSSWVFLSEVTFEAAAPVPVPASGLLLLGGVAGLAAWRRKRS